MLTSSSDAPVSLADVFPSCLASLGVDSFPNLLGLPTARSAVIVLVDGLGELNLTSHKGHARFLCASMARRGTLRTVFPSTTASALASLTTGTLPSEHGLTGYKVRDPHSDVLINQLKDLGSLADVSAWSHRAPLYLEAQATGMTTTVVSHPRLTQTSLSEVIHRGATMRGVSPIEERFTVATRLVSHPGSHYVLVYVSELDEAAHRSGVNSQEWITALEELDATCRDFVANTPQDVGILLTADHGVIDVPAHRQVLYGDNPADLQGVLMVGGEPRCLQLYAEVGADIHRIVEHWRSRMENIAQVLTRSEMIDRAGWSSVSESIQERLGDIFILAQKQVAFYDARDEAQAGRNMIGQHGSMSDEEMRIPLLTWGAYS